MLQALKKIHYKFDIIILTTILAVSIIERVHIDMIFYNAGLVNGIGFKALSYGLLYELSKIVIVLFAVTRIFFHLKPGKRNKKCAVTALVSFLIYIGSWIFMFTFDQPGAVHHLRGFEKWVAKNVDVDAVQTWIMSPDADQYLRNKSSTYINYALPKDLPDFVSNFGPEYIAFRADESDKGRHVEIGWSTLGGSWGIIVGSPTMKTKQEGMIRHSKYHNEFRRPIKSGVYIFNEG